MISMTMLEARVGSEWLDHHAVAKALHLESANMGSPFVFGRFPADHSVTTTFKRGAIVSCIATRRGVRGSRQHDQRKHQHDRLCGTERFHGSPPSSCFLLDPHAPQPPVKPGKSRQVVAKETADARTSDQVRSTDAWHVSGAMR